MVSRSPIVKHDNVQVNVNLHKIWELIKEFSPSILKSPLTLLNLTLQVLNQITIVVLFAVLLGQTVTILNGNERRYINLRHLLIKWISLVVIITLATHIKRHTTYDEMFEFMCNLLAFGMVYPSKFIKNLHLKYFAFSERKKHEDSGEDPADSEMSFLTRILSSFTVFFLNACRYIITFIAPQHRKKIEEAMRGVNLVIVEEKYFWKMYQTNAKASIVIPQSTNEIPSTFQSAGSLTKSGLIKKTSADLPKETSKSPRSASKNNALRAKVTQFLELTTSSFNSIADKKYSEYRKIEITYNCETSQLTVTDEDTGQSTVHDLLYFNSENNLFLKLGFDNQEEPLLVQFRNKKEFDLFYNTLYLEAQYQSAR